MIKSLRESKATLSALVERAARGEETVITVRGRPRARLCPIPMQTSSGHRKWARQLRETREKYSVGKRDSGQAIMDALRDERT